MTDVKGFTIIQKAEFRMMNGLGVEGEVRSTIYEVRFFGNVVP